MTGEREWQAAGLWDASAADAADRRALLGFLQEQGCSVEEMVEAHRQGRLFALAGDRLVRPGLERLTATQAADALGIETAYLERVWRGFGLPVPDLSLSPDDVEALRTVVAIQGLVGEEAALAMARVIGSGMSRAAEAGSAAMRAGFSQVALGVTGSEELTARAYAEVAALVPGVARLMDAVYRHHIHHARRHFEAVEGAAVGLGVRCGVGFADLSGFTTLSHQLSLDELAKTLTSFEELASQVVQERGGRVVKFIGDAVLFVAPTAAGLVDIAAALVTHPAAAGHGIAVRSGCAFGEVLARDGDYFGTPVNLAARLTDATAPGTLLVDAMVAAAIGPRAGAAEDRVLRGFAEPVATHLVTPLV